MDEKGFIMGLASRSKVICSQLGQRICSDGKRNVQAAIKIAQDGKQELLTVIECVSATGQILPPLIIYKGTHHYMGWHQFTYSKKGWTSRGLAIYWLMNIFNKYSNSTQSISNPPNPPHAY